MVSRLIAIRHAKPASGGYLEDHLRPLSEEGKELQKKVTKKIQEGGYSPDFILCSPLLRAQETAEIVGNIFNSSVKDEEALGYEFDVEKLLKKIPLPESNKTICFVGHAPTLAHFVNELVGEYVLSDGLSKSQAIVIEFDEEVCFGKGKFMESFVPLP